MGKAPWHTNNEWFPARVFFMYKYEFGAAAADSVAGIPYIISAFVSPVLGQLRHVCVCIIPYITLIIWGCLCILSRCLKFFEW